jgi:hypothetical protein
MEALTPRGGVTLFGGFRRILIKPLTWIIPINNLTKLIIILYLYYYNNYIPAGRNIIKNKIAV